MSMFGFLRRRRRDSGNPLSNYVPVPFRAPEAELDSALKEYQTLPGLAQNQATDFYKKNNLDTESLGAQQNVSGEAGMRLRGMRGVETPRINALRAKLGLPELPSGYSI